MISWSGPALGYQSLDWLALRTPPLKAVFRDRSCHAGSVQCRVGARKRLHELGSPPAFRLFSIRVGRWRVRGTVELPVPTSLWGHHSMKQSQTGSSTMNNRTQMRIRVQIPINLTLQNGSEPISAMSLDISWGGALFTVSESIPTDIRSVLIRLPWVQGEHLLIEATVLRTKLIQNGQYLVAVRFSSLLPENELRLEKLLAVLGKSDAYGNSDEPNGLFDELDVIVSDVDELRQILTQIATGRYTLPAFKAYASNQSIVLSIEGPKYLPAIRLRARVVQVQQPPTKETNAINVCSVALEFEHARESLGPLVDYLLGILDKRSEASYTTRSSRAGSTWRSAATNTRCAIEIDYPELLHNLTAGWGDVKAFEVLFRDMTLGEIGQSGSFPPDVWEELSFAQVVHDQAYGLSEARRRHLIPRRCI